MADKASGQGKRDRTDVGGGTRQGDAKGTGAKKVTDDGGGRKPSGGGAPKGGGGRKK